MSYTRIAAEMPLSSSAKSDAMFRCTPNVVVYGAD